MHLMLNRLQLRQRLSQQVPGGEQGAGDGEGGIVRRGGEEVSGIPRPAARGAHRRDGRSEWPTGRRQCRLAATVRTVPPCGLGDGLSRLSLCWRTGGAR